MFGSIQGYTVTEVSRKKAAREDFPAQLREKALSVLEGKGYVYAFRDKQQAYACCYLLRKVREEKQNTLILEEVWTAPEFEAHREEADKIILEEVKEKLLFGSITKLQWNETVITEKELEEAFCTYWILALPLGIVFGLMFDNLAIGICIGLSLATCFGAAGRIQVGQNKKPDDSQKEK